MKYYLSLYTILCISAQAHGMQKPLSQRHAKAQKVTQPAPPSAYTQYIDYKASHGALVPSQAMANIFKHQRDFEAQQQRNCLEEFCCPEPEICCCGSVGCWICCISSTAACSLYALSKCLRNCR
jgi:hypothetical protein